MSSASEGTSGRMIEALHAASLACAALGLLGGLIARNSHWVNLGVSLILLLPSLRLATTVIGETRAKRYGVALMGTLVLAFLLFSRRIS